MQTIASVRKSVPRLGLIQRQLCASSKPLTKLQEGNRPKMLSSESVSHFQSLLPQVLQDLTSLPRMQKLSDTNQWLGEILPKLLTQGEYFRAEQIISLDNSVRKGEVKEDADLAGVNAWCFEMAQRSYTLMGDMMEGIQRKGDLPTWHVQNSHGLAAVSDGLIISSSSSMLNQLYFGSKPYYRDMINLRNFVTHSMLYGKSRSLRSARNREFQRFDMKYYTQLKVMMDGYNGIYGPVYSVLIMNDLHHNPKLSNQIKKISEELGVLFGSNVDMYGSRDHPEKCDVDIRNGNCTWQFAKAMEVASSDQRRNLKIIYGTSAVDQVKQVYKDLNIEELYRSWEEMKIQNVVHLLDQLEDERLENYFLDFIASTFGYRI